jgi:hypothetical protein
LVNFGNFGQIWAEPATLPVADSMPSDGLKTLKPHNSYIVNPKTTRSGSLESYDPYLLPQKVSKNLHAFAIHSNIPKIQNAIFWPLKSFGN